MADDYKDLISEGDDFDGTVVMADEEGNEISFTFLDLLEYEGESYVLLLPTQEGSKGMQSRPMRSSVGNRSCRTAVRKARYSPARRLSAD